MKFRFGVKAPKQNLFRTQIAVGWTGEQVEKGNIFITESFYLPSLSALFIRTLKITNYVFPYTVLSHFSLSSVVAFYNFCS